MKKFHIIDGTDGMSCLATLEAADPLEAFDNFAVSRGYGPYSALDYKDLCEAVYEVDGRPHATFENFEIIAWETH